MYEKVKAYILENRMIEKGDCVLAGVSGGADSVAMLSVLVRLQAEWGFPVRVLHIHHGIRGQEADRDEKFVEQICEKWKIPFRSRHFQVPFLAQEWKTGLEEAGRIVRRRALLKEAESWTEGRVRIALAHNRDDLGETMLFHLARGSGIRGLSGIRPVSGNMIRPVLCLRRKEIEHYLKENEIPYVTDSTNFSDAYTRNKIRHVILPLIEEELNPRACDHMAQTAEILARADGYLSGQGSHLLHKYEKEDGYLFLPEFFQEPLLAEYAVMEGFETLAGKRRDFQSGHVKMVLSLYGSQVGRRYSLPYGLFAQRRYEGVWLGKEETHIRDSGKAKEEWPVAMPGKTDTPLGSFLTKIFPYQGEKIPEKTCTKWLDYDKIDYGLSVRTRREGDYLTVNREGGRKKLTRCMIDDKMPREQRDGVPLLTCGSEVLWITGGRINEKYKITRDTIRVLEVTYQGGSSDE